MVFRSNGRVICVGQVIDYVKHQELQLLTTKADPAYCRSCPALKTIVDLNRRTGADLNYEIQTVEDYEFMISTYTSLTLKHDKRLEAISSDLVANLSSMCGYFYLHMAAQRSRVRFSKLCKQHDLCCRIEDFINDTLHWATVISKSGDLHINRLDLRSVSDRIQFTVACTTLDCAGTFLDANHNVLILTMRGAGGMSVALPLSSQSFQPIWPNRA
ncbi:hypothetical protein EVG20_g11019 [Dentipellis fragilis]|uniref:Uncharacterized protein n=1 Tax=Dentipellis fragilis TaxID=205917 RepID=A0A4Y9XNS8_9AGAM|nr:hypothetical protein EVG20_g11019 [Dentipellis fragilis]